MITQNKGCRNGGVKQGRKGLCAGYVQASVAAPIPNPHWKTARGGREEGKRATAGMQSHAKHFPATTWPIR